MRSVQDLEAVFTRMYSGSINADGTISRGVGFVTAKGGTGNYICRFPGVRYFKAFTAMLGSGSGFITLNGYSGTDYMQILTYNNGAAALDIPWTFIGLAVLLR